MKPNSKDGFFLSRLKSIKYAFRGAWLLLKTEASIQIQFFIALIMTLVGFYMHLSSLEWIMQLLAIGLVLVAEASNTAIEKLSDYIEPNFDKRIGFIKDIAAGAPAIAAVIAIIIGLIIYVPKFY